VVKEKVEDLPRAPVNNEIPDSANVQNSKVSGVPSQAGASENVNDDI
jgi:hypothetical protein